MENKTITKITSKERQETRLWDEIALREAIINAFVHNDYTNEIPPKFEIFDNRIEITSTGGLPESLSQEEFFEGFSVPRNKEIMRVFKDLDLVEQLGSGIPRILESYPKECFKFSDNFLRMTFPISDQANDQANDQVSDQAAKNESLKIAYDALVSRMYEMFTLSKKPSEKQLKKYILIAKKLTDDQIKILEYAKTPKSNKEIQEDCLGLKKHNDNFKKYLEPLLVADTLRRTLPKVPNSPLQKYFISEAGNVMLYIRENKIEIE